MTRTIDGRSHEIAPMRWIAAFLGVWLVACVPLLVTEILPLVDYPGHLVRVHLLANWDNLAGYDEYYRPSWVLLPNLALELIAVPLAKIMPATTAVRVFCALVIGLMIYGGARLNWAVTGQRTVWSLAPALLVYSHVFAYGFLNFLFGLGLCLVALAFHIEGCKQSNSVRLLREIAFATALFFCHLVTLAVYVVAALTYETTAALQRRAHGMELIREYALLLAGLIVPAVLLSLSPTQQEAVDMEFPALKSKITKTALILMTGQGVWDDIFALSTLVAIGALFFLRHLRIHRTMAVVTLVLTGVFILAPYRFATAENVDTRLPLVFLCTGIASLGIRSTRVSVVLAMLVPLFLFRFGTTTFHYALSGQELERLRADMRAVPKSSLLFRAIDESASIFQPWEWHPPLAHACELLLLDRPSYSASLFTEPTQQPLVRSPEFAALEVREQVGHRQQSDLSAYATRLADKLAAAGRREPAYVYFLKGATPPAPTNRFDLVLDRPRFSLYRLPS
jgi:hypothetical protein